jgi:cell division septum initiation protein DivIVA
MDDPNAPATKQDVAQLRSEMTQGVAQLRSEMQHQFDDLKETYRDGQTELLRAIYSFAGTADTKLKEAEMSDMMLRQRLSAVETRLLEVEKRLNLPPAA